MIARKITQERKLKKELRGEAKKTRVNFRIPLTLQNRINDLAISLGVSKSELIRQLLELALDECDI